jgi:hypothetical protein
MAGAASRLQGRMCSQSMSRCWDGDGVRARAGARP